MEYKYDPTRSAVSSLVLGIIGSIAWIIPLFGIPITIIGIAAAKKGRKSSKRGMATVGLVLNIVFLVASAINSILGALSTLN